MVDRRLTRAWDRVARAALPDAALRQELANRSVINPDATVDPAAIGTALSLPIYFDIAGAASTGTNVAQQRRLVQAGDLWQIRADAKTAPSGEECTLWLAVNGVANASVTIQPGELAGTTPMSVPAPPGAVLTLNCTAANGCSDISVVVAMRPS